MMTESQTRDVEEAQISYDQFCSDCQHIVKISEELGDKWRIGQRDGIQWLEFQELKTVKSGDDEDDDRKLTVLASHEVHYSLSYGVPVLFTRFSLMSGELVEYEQVRRRILDPGVTQDMVSMAAHPLTGLPWLQVTSSAFFFLYLETSHRPTLYQPLHLPETPREKKVPINMILRSILVELLPLHTPSAISESMMMLTTLIMVEEDVTI